MTLSMVIDSPRTTEIRHVDTGRNDMARCDQCGNDYDKTFEVVMAGQTYVFDSFECAVHKLAPVCPHCGCRIGVPLATPLAVICPLPLGGCG